MQAARDVLNRAEEVIAANQEAIRQAVKDIATFSASLARNSDNVDIIVSDAKDTMKNAKEATASARTLMDNLDKRTEEITVGVNRMTSTATRQIDIAGRAITDLAHNPQRFLFGAAAAAAAVRQRRRRRCRHRRRRAHHYAAAGCAHHNGTAGGAHHNGAAAAGAHPAINLAAGEGPLSKR